MRLITKLARGTKGFTQPPFWATSASLPLVSTPTSYEPVTVDFERYVGEIYNRHGVVFACIAARAMVFSQVRFMWQQLRQGRPGDFFGTEELRILETPWPNASTGDLLTLMEQDVSLAGNCYLTIVQDPDGTRRFRRLRPDWVIPVTGSRTLPWEQAGYAHDAQLLGYWYGPPTRQRTPSSLYDLEQADWQFFEPKDIVHYTEWPDPIANWRGMSWITPILSEIRGDMAATEHKFAFFKHGATPSMVIKYDSSISKEAFEAFVERFKQEHEGLGKGYKTLHLGGGADVVPLTFDFRQLDFKSLQGSAETRIAAAAGAHPVIVGLSEGLQGSSLNAGNFQAARRLFIDGRIRYLWSKAAPALQSVLQVPGGARLWYDDRDIPFLRDDAIAEARRRQIDATTINTLITAGFKPVDVVEAVTSGDLRRLTDAHTGLLSVQLQPVEMPQALDEGGTQNASN